MKDPSHPCPLRYPRVDRRRLKNSTPFGECLTERSRRINLGQEGTLILGAMSGYAISYLSGSPWLGVAAAGLAGLLLGVGFANCRG